jgi:hypothetical protein
MQRRQILTSLGAFVFGDRLASPAGLKQPPKTRASKNSTPSEASQCARLSGMPLSASPVPDPNENEGTGKHQ